MHTAMDVICHGHQRVLLKTRSACRLHALAYLTAALLLSLRPHTPALSQVRALCVCDLGLVTASRDRTLKLWKEDAGQYTLHSTFAGHQSYVTAVAYLPPGLAAGFPAGAIVSGDASTSLHSTFL